MPRPKPLAKATIISDRAPDAGDRVPVYLFRDTSGAYRWYYTDSDRNFIPSDVEGITESDARYESVRAWACRPFHLKASWYPGANAPVPFLHQLPVTFALAIITSAIMFAVLWYLL